MKSEGLLSSSQRVPVLRAFSDFSVVFFPTKAEMLDDPRFTHRAAFDNRPT